MTRRFVAVVAACLALLGVAAVPLAAPAKADPMHVYSPVPTGLLRVCVIVQAADSGLCVHL